MVPFAENCVRLICHLTVTGANHTMLAQLRNGISASRNAYSNAASCCRWAPIPRVRNTRFGIGNISRSHLLTNYNHRASKRALARQGKSAADVCSGPVGVCEKKGSLSGPAPARHRGFGRSQTSTGSNQKTRVRRFRHQRHSRDRAPLHPGRDRAPANRRPGSRITAGLKPPRVCRCLQPEKTIPAR